MRYPDSTIYKVFHCKEDITGSIHNIDDNLRFSCCSRFSGRDGDYAIISTGDWRAQYDIHREEGIAYLVDGTKCFLRDDAWMPVYEDDEGNEIEYGYAIPDVRGRSATDNMLAHLHFRLNITNTRWAALYYKGGQVVEARRLTTLFCFKCGEDELAMCPIMDDMDLQRWELYDNNTIVSDGCITITDYIMKKWIHNFRRDRRVPNLTEEEKELYANWLAAYPLMGAYIAVNGELLSVNSGAERDIQEVASPDPATHEFTPRGGYLYFNDRNAAVRYDKRIQSDQEWDYYCNNIYVSLTLDDLAAAPSIGCQDDGGRIALSGNGVLFVFCSDFGRMDYSASSGRRLA